MKFKFMESNLWSKLMSMFWEIEALLFLFAAFCFLKGFHII